MSEAKNLNFDEDRDRGIHRLKLSKQFWKIPQQVLDFAWGGIFATKKMFFVRFVSIWKDFDQESF